jgi:hypothetical protein
MLRVFGFIVIVGVLLFSTESCQKEFNLNGNFVETAVVIGLLDQSETAHMIKITRAFIGDGSTSALTIAQIADSSYFQNVDAVVRERDGNGNVIRTFQMHDTLVQNKDITGAFYAPEQKVYVFYTTSANPLSADYTYTLDINIDNGRINIQGETRLVSGMTLNSNIANFNSNLKFADNNGGYRNQTIDITSTGSAVRVNAKITFFYSEFNVALTDSVNKSVTLNLGEIDLSTGTTNHQFSASGEAFYNLIASNITTNANIGRRRYYGLQIDVTGASSDFASYIAVNQPSSNLAQNKPDFTNLDITSGYKVIGVFSARNILKVFKPATGGVAFIRAMDQASVRALCIGPVTGTYLFCSNHTADATANPNNIPTCY